jgi:hypothetical protein
LKANAQAGDCHGNNIWIDGEFEECSALSSVIFFPFSPSTRIGRGAEFCRKIPLNSGREFRQDSRNSGVMGKGENILGPGPSIICRMASMIPGSVITMVLGYSASYS